MSDQKVKLKTFGQYLIVKFILSFTRFLPRFVAIQFGYMFAWVVYFAFPKLRKIGYLNLQIAFPEKSLSEHKKILQGAYRNLGRLLGEFSQFPKLSKNNISKIVEYEGLENYLKARDQGKGIIFLTAHFGSWELSAVAHSLYGYSMNVLVRRLDNYLIENLVEKYRTASGNKTIGKNQSARTILSALRRGETIGILSDLNMVRNQGIFCDFFGIPACSTPILASLAAHTGAAVIPVFLIWNETKKNYKLQFDTAIELITTENFQENIEKNTARFMKVIEAIIRKYPEQWLWIHKRWKTRPMGQTDIY